MAPDGLVDMCSCNGGRPVFASNTGKSDVVADGVLLDVDAILEDTACAGLTGSGHSASSDDLLWSGFDDVLRVKVEKLLVLLPPVIGPLVVPVLLAVLLVVGLLVVVVGGRSSYSEGSAQKNERCGEMHRE